MQKTALITGVTGQDGSYLAELLLSKGYQVHGVVRRASLFNTDRIDHLHVGEAPNPAFFLHYGDLSDAGALRNLLDEVQPDEVYNLGAQSHVRVSFDQPEYTVDVVGVGVIRLLEAIREEVAKDKLPFIVAETGCIGWCSQEPLLDVAVPGKPRVTYGRMTPERARKIIVSFSQIGWRKRNLCPELANRLCGVPELEINAPGKLVQPGIKRLDIKALLERLNCALSIAHAEL